MRIFTLGYEGLYIDEFLDFLLKKKIKVLVDVRKNPVSRKKGFSKNKLAAHLKEQGIEYYHFPDIGVPSAWRKLAKAKKLSREKMFRDYDRKILPKRNDLLKEILKISKRRTALLCFERDALDCHRSFITKRMKKVTNQKIEAVHLEAIAKPFRLSYYAPT